MRILLAYIAVKYREMQNGELNTFGTNWSLKFCLFLRL
jgi:hypothetical protein